ncbi:MAG: bifunctional (p)ppGpp synthetase/guanosine-3',5'-bis(diphosphate) 3'-pyrophosphohydrolase [Candidatus Delongbacteria bacterium]|nr:bifunctional (p)ppGpp synthetase/guanosine-3',5'-bis(diphosphate) 3'-pyrophosphohydrolase [Candidatus Delongbacteria bacterium]
MTTRNKEDYQLNGFLHAIRDTGHPLDLDIISYAFKFSQVVHYAQLRKSGEPYFIHCYQTALILAQLMMDTDTVVAGLLHDTLEDTQVSKEVLTDLFGEEIAFLVEGVTKFKTIKYQNIHENVTENFLKLFMAMAQDPRVIIIKCADRLHNMRTLEHLKPRRQVEIARETMDIYAPLAHRFGIGQMKWELEDLAFKYLYPDEYLQLVNDINEKREVREESLRQIIDPIRRELEKNSLSIHISSRPKHLWSVFLKMKSKGYSLDRVFDLLAIRIITTSKEQCYYAMGIIHSLYKPIHERFKDYIANPKSNLYQSIHTTIMTNDGRAIEIQIRTQEMHRVAEIGIAAHWQYKEGKSKISEMERKKVEWIRQLIEWHQLSHSQDEFIKALKDEVYEQEIFVFTPKGHPMNFILGATVLDFAFAIHTDVGIHCSGAKINNKIVPLNTELKNNDSIEIITSPHKTPSRDWLDMVKTIRAKSKIKNWFKKEGLAQAQQIGHGIFEQHIKRSRLTMPTDTELLSAFNAYGYNELSLGFAAIGNGDLSIVTLLNRLFPKDQMVKPESRLQKILDFTRRESKGIRIESIENVMYHFAKCCQPIPGDSIIGFISRGRGIVIHKSDCPNITSIMAQEDRIIHVIWDVSGNEFFTGHVKVQSKSNPNLLSDISHIVTDLESKLLQLKMEEESYNMTIDIVIEIKNLTHLSKIISKIKKLKGIYQVNRI